MRGLKLVAVVVAVLALSGAGAAANAPQSGPKGLKEKASYSTKTTAVTDAEFEKTFTTPGTYKFICTIHPMQMHMTSSSRTRSAVSWDGLDRRGFPGAGGRIPAGSIGNVAPGRTTNALHGFSTL
jgi:hypothetical protein